MSNYAKQLPIDKGGSPMQEYPAPFTTTGRSMRENAGVSSVVLLNPNTSTIEVGATGGQGVVIRWIPASETPSQAPFSSVVASGLGANFDHFVPPATYRRFVVPRDVGGQPSGQVGSVNGLYSRVAIISAGTTATSVLVSEQ